MDALKLSWENEDMSNLCESFEVPSHLCELTCPEICGFSVDRQGIMQVRGPRASTLKAEGIHSGYTT